MTGSDAAAMLVARLEVLLVKNVLFVCLGNSCRSQMAEGFARKYGHDVLSAWSAGLAPAPIVQPLTILVMEDKNIDISQQFPKSVDELELNAFDVIINMSGLSLPANIQAEVRVWDVADPMGQSGPVYLAVRDLIEDLVMQYILELRRRVRAQRPLPRVNTRAAAAPVLQPGQTASKTPKVVGQPGQRMGFGRMRNSRD